MSSVLIIDDESGIRDFLARWLAGAGYETRQAGDAETALALLEAAPSDVVLCDVNMPGHDGLWLVERLRERFPTVAIVLATAADSIPPVVSLREGVVDYLVKPFERALVLAAVVRGVEWHAAMVARTTDTPVVDPLAEWMSGKKR